MARVRSSLVIRASGGQGWFDADCQLLVELAGEGKRGGLTQLHVAPGHVPDPWIPAALRTSPAQEQPTISSECTGDNVVCDPILFVTQHASRERLEEQCAGMAEETCAAAASDLRGPTGSQGVVGRSEQSHRIDDRSEVATNPDSTLDERPSGVKRARVQRLGIRHRDGEPRRGRCVVASAQANPVTVGDECDRGVSIWGCLGDQLGDAEPCRVRLASRSDVLERAIALGQPLISEEWGWH